jgi:hypothetical protein
MGLDRTRNRHKKTIMFRFLKHIKEGRKNHCLVVEAFIGRLTEGDGPMFCVVAKMLMIHMKI